MKAVRQNIGVAFVPREDIRNAAALNSLSFNVSHTLGQAVFGLVTALGASLLGGAGDEMRGLAFPFHLNMASFVLVLWVYRFRAASTVGRAMLADVQAGLGDVHHSSDCSSDGPGEPGEPEGQQLQWP